MKRLAILGVLVLLGTVLGACGAGNKKNETAFSGAGDCPTPISTASIS